MIKRVLSAILAVILLLNLTACGKTSDIADNTLTVYYLNALGYNAGGEYIKAWDYNMQPDDDLINNALELLVSPPANLGLSTALVKGTQIYSYSLEKDEICVTLSPAYLLLNDLEKTLVKCCLSLTLCGIAEVESVSIYVDDKLVAADLNERTMIIEDAETNEFEKQISLYFPRKDEDFLQPEHRVLTVGSDKSAAEYIIEELLKSTQNDDLKAAVPEGTRLLSANVRNGVCAVNFSKEFVDNRPMSAAGQRLTVYSLVNSVTKLDNTENVIFLIEGKPASGYEFIDISDTFSAFEEIIYNPQELDKLFATVYLGNPSSGKMVMTPVIIDRRPEITIEENIVRYILSLHNVGGYEDIIPYSVMLRSIDTVNDTCVVDVTSALFAGGSLQVATLASCAIAASVIDSGVVSKVSITVEGKRYLDNMTRYSELIVE